MKKRFLTLFIAIVMVMTMLPVTALTAFAATTYTVTVDSTITHGTITASPTTAAEGDTVTLTVSPDTDYSLASATLKVSDGTNEIELTSGANDTYTFTMPAANVTVSARFGIPNDGLYYVNDTDIGVTTIFGSGALSASSWQSKVLSKVVIEEGIDSIGVNAFRAYSSLESITIPASVASIGAYVFQGCSSLTDVTYLGTSEPTISASTFTGCDGLSSVTVPAGYTGSTFGGITVVKSGASTTPTVTGVSFNDSSAAYNSGTNTFNVSDTTPFILTITGENLTELTGDTLRALFYGDAQGSGGVIISVTVESDTRAYVSVNTSKLTYILSNAVGAGAASSTKATSVEVKNGDKTVGTVNVNLVHATTTPAIYTISVTPPTNGSVAVPASMAAGSTVTFTVTPNTNYEIDTITVSDGTNTIPPAPGQVAGAYTFTMPASDVTITATFKAKASIPATVTITEVIISDYQDSGVVTVDTPNKTYTITIPADQDRTTATVTVKGENLDKITDENSTKHILIFSYGGSIQLSPTNLQSSGDMVFNSSINQNKIGSAEMKYSTDGGTTWTPIGWTTVVQKASTTYTVTVDSAIENGAVTANSADASEGDTVILTATPADGYELDTLAVTDENGEPVTVTNNAFIMPASDVIVTATFKKIEYATKTELEAAVAELNKAIEELEEASATANELSAVVSAVNTLKATMESTYATKAELKAVEDALKAADEALTAAVELLTRVLAAANDRITANEGNIATNTGAIADLADKMTQAQQAIDALQTNSATKQELTDAIDGLKSTLEASIATLQTQVDGIEATLKTATDNISVNAKSIEELKTAMDAAQKAIEALQTSTAATQAQLDALETAFNQAKTALEATDKVLQDNIDTVKSELDQAVADLNEAIKAGDDALGKRISAISSSLSAARKALEQADADNKAELVAMIEAAEAALDAAVKAVQKNLDDAKAELNRALAEGDKANADALAQAITNLNTAIDGAEAAAAAADADLTAKIDSAEAALEKAIEALAAELDSTKTALMEKDSKLQTFVIIVCVVSGVAFCGCGALALWVLDTRRKLTK